MRVQTSNRTSTRSGEDGTGLLGSVVGVTVFLVLLLFAVQVGLNLYATSTVTAVAFDAAREVAGSASGVDATAAAEARARGVLDRFPDEQLAFEWELDADTVAVTVRATRSRLLPNVRLPFETIERTVRVRREAPR